MNSLSPEKGAIAQHRATPCVLYTVRAVLHDSWVHNGSGVYDPEVMSFVCIVIA